VWAKYGQDKKVQQYIIVEAKGQGAKLSTKADKGAQMSKQWVENTAKSMQNSTKAADRELGTALTDALKKGAPPKVIGKVIQINKDGVPKWKSVPGGGVYN
jgi:hypothetical protein